MNINNKFGECCNCPALMQDGRNYASHVPRRDHNASLMKEFKVNNSNDYRSFLQNNGKSIINSVHKSLIDNYRCISNDTNKFYDSTDIHKYFNELFLEELKKPVQEAEAANNNL